MDYPSAAIQLVAVFVGSLGLAILFSRFLARMVSSEKAPVSKRLARIEQLVFRLFGVDPNRQMGWREYTVSLLVTNVVVAIFVAVILGIQGYLPFAPPGLGNLSPDLIFHTASSFITNTDLQHYAGELQLSVFSQMVAITFVMFVAPATAIAASFAFIRSFLRRSSTIGNFYVDFLRSALFLLLPVAVVSAILLIACGVPQTLAYSETFRTITGTNQTIPIGPVGSLESIKELGNNGGGFFAANSAYPFENPGGFTNIFETILMLSLPLSFPLAYGKLIGRGRGLTLLIAMLAGLGFMFALALAVPSFPVGLEERFGSTGSILFNVVSIATNTGAVNSALTGMSDHTIVALFLAMFVQSIPGADGVGLMLMIVYVILTLFIVGLMVGKTPEFLNMKISPSDIKKAVYVFLVHPALILFPIVIAFTTGNAQKIVGNNITPQSYTQILYEFTSAAANNGSDYLGTLANTPFWNISTGIVMLLGRYLPLVLMLALAGSFTLKERKVAGGEPIKTEGVTFTIVLVIMIFLLTALTFFPFLVIGPFSS